MINTHPKSLGIEAIIHDVYSIIILSYISEQTFFMFQFCKDIIELFFIFSKYSPGVTKSPNFSFFCQMGGRGGCFNGSNFLACHINNLTIFFLQNCTKYSYERFIIYNFVVFVISAITVNALIM